MKRAILGAFGLVVALSSPSWAQVKELPTETITVKGTVEQIDHATRTVNIKTADGFVALEVPQSATRFDEVKVGDKVSATYNNNVIVRLKPPGEPDATGAATTTSTMGQEAKPGGTATRQKTMTATVSAIDKSTSSMTFVGPGGWKYSRHIVDPKVFDLVKVGDKIDITWNTDLTISVE